MATTGVKCPLGESYAGVRVAVLGASGFIGRWVASALQACGARVALVVRNRSAADRILASHCPAGELFEVDLESTGDVRALFEQVQPSITFNLAGYGIDRSQRDPHTAYRINAFLVGTVCEAVARLRDPAWDGQHLVHVGSALEYGPVGGNLSETCDGEPTTLYGRTKLAGTYYLAYGCESYGIRGLTARLFTVYGPGELAGRLLPSLIETAASGCDLPLTNGRQCRDFVYVEDVAEALLRLGVSHANPGEIVNVATGRLISVRSFAETAADVLGIAAEKLRFGAVPVRAEEMQHDEVTTARFRELVEWNLPTAPAEGIRKTFQFEQTSTYRG